MINFPRFRSGKVFLKQNRVIQKDTLPTGSDLNITPFLCLGPSSFRLLGIVQCTQLSEDSFHLFFFDRFSHCLLMKGTLQDYMHRTECCLRCANPFQLVFVSTILFQFIPASIEYARKVALKIKFYIPLPLPPAVAKNTSRI